MYEVYLGLGSNIEPHTSLNLALEQLAQEFEITAVSPWYESEPFFLSPEHKVKTSAFINLMLIIKTDLSAEQVKTKLKQIEQNIEPNPSKKAHHHRIDIDLYAHEIAGSNSLKPLKEELLNAAYVLVPLLDITPHINLGSGEPLKNHLPKLKTQALKCLK